MTNPDYDLERCGWCKFSTIGQEVDLLPGYRCRGKGCDAYLIVVTKGQKAGHLTWHSPLDCEELPGPCGPCRIYLPKAAA